MGTQAGKSDLGVPVTTSIRSITNRMHAFQFAKVQHLSLAGCGTKVSIIERLGMRLCLEVGCLSQDPQLEAPCLLSMTIQVIQHYITR